jgi:hypothetical protein
MKKWLALLLCALMVLSCVACKKQDAAEEEEADYSFADGDQYERDQRVIFVFLRNGKV